MLRLLALRAAERALQTVLKNLDVIAEYAYQRSARFREILDAAGRKPSELTPAEAVKILVDNDVDLDTLIELAPAGVKEAVLVAIGLARAYRPEDVDPGKVIEALKSHKDPLVREVGEALDTEEGRQWLQRQLRRLLGS